MPRRQAESLRNADAGRPMTGARCPASRDALARLPDYLGQHVLVSLTALVLGLLISLPLAILATRRPRLRGFC